MSNESVGSLLAVIANSINDGLRIMMFADKRAWGSDEFEQLRLLEETLDEAKKDFQTLPALIHGRGYYEHDRKGKSYQFFKVSTGTTRRSVFCSCRVTPLAAALNHHP
jgi:hypothetical protein